MSKIAISVENLSKKYDIGSNSYYTLRKTLSNLFSKKQTKEEFWALNDINFTINRGETVGIIGRNGAGKSTLLKILSKITHPTSGRIVMDDLATSLLEVGTGFHPELTGRENIFLNGSILGMSRIDIKNKLDEIIDFSEVSKFIDTPVKHYSSGMYVRLAFSVAAHIRSNILLVDEVLAVGDYEFQQKCLGKMEEVSEQGRTVLFVSHNLDTIQNLCPNTILIEGGRIKYKGDTKTAISEYTSSDNHQVNTRVRGSKRVSISVFHHENDVIYVNEPFKIDVELKNNTDIDFSSTLLDVGINNFEGKRVGWLSSGPAIDIKANDIVKLSLVIKNWCYKPGKYYFTTYLKSENEVLEWTEDRFMIHTLKRKEDNLIIPPVNQGDVLLNYEFKF